MVQITACAIAILFALLGFVTSSVGIAATLGESGTDVPAADGFDSPLVDPPGTNWNGTEQSFGNCNSDAYTGGLHPGVDRNLATGGNTDVGQPMFSVANGVVSRILNLGSRGYFVAVRHPVNFDVSDGGNNQVTRQVFSVYVHLVPVTGLAEGSLVYRGMKVGSLADTTAAGFSSHAHLEIRAFLPQDVYANDNGNGYYNNGTWGGCAGTAWGNLYRDGYLDQSIFGFVASHRPDAYRDPSTPDMQALRNTSTPGGDRIIARDDNPNHIDSRSEAVTMVVRMLESIRGSTLNVSTANWPYTDYLYTSAVSKALAAGIVTSTSLFRPTEPVTRDELRAMVRRALTSLGRGQARFDQLVLARTNDQTTWMRRRETADFLIDMADAASSVTPPVVTPPPVTNSATTFTVPNQYGTNLNLQQTLSVTGASRLRVTIAGRTEQGYDYVTVFDSAGVQVGRYSGAINQTLTVNGSSIRVQFTSDSSVTDSGVTVTVAADNSSVTPPVVTPPVVTPPPVTNSATTFTVPNQYGTNLNLQQTLSVTGASRLRVTITGRTEQGYDYVTVFDSAGVQVGRYSGAINQTLTVNGSSIRVQFTSDSSVTDSGVTVAVAAI